MIARRLRERYRDYAHGNKTNPLAELLFIVCSTQTNEPLYRDTYRRMRKLFSTFDKLAKASQDQIAATMVRGGLSKQKARFIKMITEALKLKFRRPTLSPIRQLPDTDCEAFLLSLPGVGLKTARCVMLYSLNRAVFPVDVHCWRIAHRLGWIASARKSTDISNSDMNRLQDLIPPELRFSLHVNFVSLGREFCTPRKPQCHICPIRDLCPKIGI